MTAERLRYIATSQNAELQLDNRGSLCVLHLLVLVHKFRFRRGPNHGPVSFSCFLFSMDCNSDTSSAASDDSCVLEQTDLIPLIVDDVEDEEV